MSRGSVLKRPYTRGKQANKQARKKETERGLSNLDRYALGQKGGGREGGSKTKPRE